MMSPSTSGSSSRMSPCDIRVHSALGYLTPAEFEQHWLALPVNERATLCCPVLWGQDKQQKEQTPMRKLMVLSFITVDGVMQAPGGPEEDTSGGFTHGGWRAPDPAEFSGQGLGWPWGRLLDLLFGRKKWRNFST